MCSPDASDPAPNHKVFLRRWRLEMGRSLMVLAVRALAVVAEPLLRLHGSERRTLCAFLPPSSRLSTLTTNQTTSRSRTSRKVTLTTTATCVSDLPIQSLASATEPLKATRVFLYRFSTGAPPCTADDLRFVLIPTVKCRVRCSASKNPILRGEAPMRATLASSFLLTPEPPQHSRNCELRERMSIQ